MPKKAVNVRDRIVRGATDRFLAHGFSRVTMDRLAADLGVSKKTLYQHFASKEALLYTVVTGFLEETSASVKAIIGRGGDVRGRLAALMNFLSQRLSSVSPVFFEELERQTPDMWQEVQEFRRRQIVRNILKLYRSGRRQGVFSTYPAPQLTVQLFLSTVEGVMNPRVLSRLPYRPAQVMRAIITIFLFGTVSDRFRRGSGAKPPEVVK